jgi:hypothetical protein
MSVAIEAVDSDLIQDGIEEVVEVLLVDVEVVTALVVVVVLVATVVAAAEGSVALMNAKSEKVGLAAAGGADGAAPRDVAGTFKAKKDGPIEPLSSAPLSAVVEWPLCGFNGIR